MTTCELITAIDALPLQEKEALNFCLTQMVDAQREKQRNLLRDELKDRLTAVLADIQKDGFELQIENEDVPDWTLWMAPDDHIAIHLR